MASTIGPNFGNELAAAGLAGLAISWGADAKIQYGAAVTSAQQSACAAALAAHNPATPDLRLYVQVNSTGTPALNGLYAVDRRSAMNVIAIAAGIASKSRVPGGGSTFNYYDSSGAAHAFSSTNFLNFAAAIEDYVYAVQEGEVALAAGQAPSWPAGPLTIA